MITNAQFLDIVKDSFEEYLKAGSSRSTAKLKVLHGRIAKDLEEAFGPGYTVKSQGYGNGKEACLEGYYYDKRVDITIERDEKPVAGYAIKFVMRNYSQNSNNYFENMLGETTNLRANNIPYFQIFIIFDKVPHYKTGGVFQKWEDKTADYLGKYVKMSEGDPNTTSSIPDKMLIVLLKLDSPSDDKKIENFKDYAKYYKKKIKDKVKDLITYSKKANNKFGDLVILNNYEKFRKETTRISKEKE